MEVLRACGVVFGILVWGNASSAEFTAESLRDDDITQAIELLIEEAIADWQPQSHWDPTTPKYDHSPLGQTPLTILGLLHAGVKFQDPRMQPSVQWLLGASLKNTYPVACRAQALGLMPESTKTTRRLGSNDQAHRLRMLELPNSQVKIVFSREDLSYALLDRPWFNTNGYSTKSARIILHRLIYGFTPQ